MASIRLAQEVEDEPLLAFLSLGLNVSNFGADAIGVVDDKTFR